MTFSNSEATRESKKALRSGTSNLSHTNDGGKSISCGNLISLADIFDLFGNLCSSNLNSRSLSKTAATTRRSREVSCSASSSRNINLFRRVGVLEVAEIVGLSIGHRN